MVEVVLAVASLSVTEAAFLSAGKVKVNHHSPHHHHKHLLRQHPLVSIGSERRRCPQAHSFLPGAWPVLSLPACPANAMPTETLLVAVNDEIPTQTINVILSTADTVDALSTQDILVGILLAFLLALLASFLQGQSSSSFPNFVLWTTRRDISGSSSDDTMDSGMEDDNLESLEANTTAFLATGANITDQQNKVFNATDWKDISRPENYILYSNPSLRANENPQVKRKAKNDNTVALMGLLLLFVPIFGAELFLALSRQFLCESSSPSTILVLPWAPQDLCAPIYR